MNNKIIEQIRTASFSKEPVSRAVVETWMKVDDLRVLKEVRYFISFAQEYIEPGLDEREIDEFKFSFLERCLVENPEGVISRSHAAKDIVGLFQYDSYGVDLEDESLVRAKDWLSHLYIDYGPDIREAVAWALRHVFKRRGWREFFSDWTQNTDLLDFYEAVCKEAVSISDEATLEEAEIAISTESVIPQDQVKRWMKSPDIEVQGLVADMISYSPNWERIEPPLSEQEMEDFILPYYRRCFVEDTVGDWCANRYDVGREILSWFMAVPETEDANEQIFLMHLRDWMAQVYKESDQDIRGAIVASALEHILEEPRWYPVFEGWRSDPVLREAYEQAMSWAVEHERQPGNDM